MKKHTVRLLGGSNGAVRVPAESLLEAIASLVDGGAPRDPRDQVERLRDWLRAHVQSRSVASAAA